MSNDYYQKTLFLAAVDSQNTLVGPVERWEAHREGILHRGFTVILKYEGEYLLQQRKHVAFDDCWDFTFSSHQIMKGDKLESDEDAIYRALAREWHITKEDIQGDIQYLGTVYYKAKDPKSVYTEHEFDAIYMATLNKLPEINKEFAYGYERISFSKGEKEKVLSKFSLAPWVKQMIQTISII